MQLDTDYLDRQQRARRERWRLRLTAVALFSCAVMLGDLVATARSLENDDRPVILCPDDADRPEFPAPIDHPTLAKADRDTAFNFSDRTLCSGGN